MIKTNFSKIYPIICLTFLSLFIQSCATTDTLQKTKNPLTLIGLPFEIVSNTLQVPLAILERKKPKFSFGEEARFDRAWLSKDYMEATQLVKDGLNLNYKVNNQSIYELAAQCVDQRFSRAVVNRGGSLSEFKSVINPNVKQAIAQGDESLIKKYFDCGYPISSDIDSESLVYWAGFYKSNNVASVLNNEGTNSSDYQRGLGDGRDSRINSAISTIFASHVAGHYFKGANILSAAWNESMTRERAIGLTQLYQELDSSLNSQEIKALVIVTGLVLDDKVSIENLEDRVARSIIEDEINKVNPGMGSSLGFAYQVIKRMNANN